jgi:nicotinamide-nucleotide amidase
MVRPVRCEVVAVGTELLLGQIVDTNSAWIGEQLALSGIDSFFQTKVGDNLDRIVSAFELALSRSDAVIVCGGLGPTQDDITRPALAKVMGVELVRDEALGDVIRHMFESRGRVMPENNLLQAEVPVGASIIEQRMGTAPGLICPVGDKVLYAVPGVPYEMQEMVERAILPDLRRRAGDTATIVSRTLRTWGDSESGLAEKLTPVLERLDESGGATVAFLASGIEGLKVRITAKAPTEAEARTLLDAEEVAVREIVGEHVFGTDDQTMEAAVLDLLGSRGLTLGLAESVTGGLMGSRITDVPGASKVFRGSIVSYASQVKFDLLGVPEGPVVSDDAVMAMAAGARRVLGADVGLAVSGVAGPDGQDGQRPGTVFVGLAVGDEVDSTMLRLPGDRDRVRQFSVISALDWLRRHPLMAP